MEEKNKITWYKSLGFKISLIIIWLGVATIFLMTFSFLRHEKRVLEEELKKRGLNIALNLARQAAEPILYEDQFVLYRLIKALTYKGGGGLEENIVDYGLILDGEGRILAHNCRHLVGKYLKEEIGKLNSLNPETYLIEPSGKLTLDITVPISVKGTKIGLARIGINKESLLQTISEVESRIFLSIFVIVVGGVLLGVWLTRKITNPLKLLTKRADQMGQGDWGKEVEISSSDEIGKLSQTFNQMSRRLKEYLDEIKEAQQHLIQKEKLSALGELSAGLAHELKNPLTSIKMIMQAIEEDKEGEITDKDIDIILKEIQQMDSILTQFLDFAKPSRLDLDFYDPDFIVGEAVSLTKRQLEEKKIKLRYQKRENLPLIRLDGKKMKQAFLNIIINAIQAMPLGGILWIKTEVNQRKKELIIKIKDSGDGIAEEIKDKIFDPFFTTKDKGTGLGLSTAYSIIKEHQGEISVESSVGKGSAFAITLPLEVKLEDESDISSR